MAVLICPLNKQADKLPDFRAYIDQIIVIENNQKMISNMRKNLIGQACCQMIEVDLTLIANFVKRLFPKAGETRLNRGNKMGNKPYQILIQFIQCNPASGNIYLMCDIRYERGFSITCRSCNQN